MTNNTLKPALRITSFGYAHPDPTPRADLVVDLREWFRDPHVDPAVREMTGRDMEIHKRVHQAPGFTEYRQMLLNAIRVLVDLRYVTVEVAVGCVGGRHRSVVMAETLAAMGEGRFEWEVEVVHRDIDKPVVQRGRSMR